MVRFCLNSYFRDAEPSEMGLMGRKLEELIPVSNSDVARFLRIRVNCWTLAVPQIPMRDHSIGVEGKPGGTYQRTRLGLHICEIVLRTHNPSIIRTARIVRNLSALAAMRFCARCAIPRQRLQYFGDPKIEY